MSEELDHESVETAAHWFIAIAGLIYATGFLTVSTFLSRFGITEEGSEVFKAKYVFVGILYLLLPVIIGVPVVSLLFMRAKAQARADQVSGPTRLTPPNPDQTSSATQSEQRPVNLPSIIITVNLLLVFYIYVLFAPPGFLETREWVIPVLFLSAFLSLVIIQWLEGPLEKPLDLWAKAFHASDAERWKKKVIAKYRIYSRWLLCVLLMLPASVLLLWQLFTFLGKILWNRRDGSGAYVLLLVVGLMGWLVLVAISRTEPMKRARRLAREAIVACLVGALYYFSVLIFANRVYPYIPALRGGGDYSESPKAQLRFKKESVDSLPKWVLLDPNPNSGGQASKDPVSKDLVILEASPSSIIAADPREAGGPVCWRGPKRPKVTIAEIRRDDVESISYSNVTSRSVPQPLPDCAKPYTSDQLDQCCPAD